MELLLAVTIFVVAVTLSVVITNKMEKIKRLSAETGFLRQSLNEMDEQAKLIVRTDLELNKTQEELDKKITGLYTLQKLSRSISTTLEENQIFNLIDQSYLKDLGFEKACVFLWNEVTHNFSLPLHLGYSPEEKQLVESFVKKGEATYLNLIQNNQSVSSISLTHNLVLKEEVEKIFNVRSFIISVISPKEGEKGFLLVGTEHVDTTLTEGDEELIGILANQIGQSLENARLFEKTWRAHQELENKVEERTRELKLMMNELQVISKRKTEFISAVSHELRTPLTSIKGYASILLTGKLGELPEEIKLRLEKINRHSDELTHLVNDLLDIARIESGKVVMKLDRYDLSAMVAQVQDLLGVQFKDRQLEFSTNIPEGARFAMVDYTQINRVFINLLGNALKFTPAGGKISVSTKMADKQIQIDVTDTGSGIPQEALSAIFEEFYRVDNDINQHVRGTGLGLSLVKHIVEAHQGKIWVNSKLGVGSTFSFTLLAAE